MAAHMKACLRTHNKTHRSRQSHVLVQKPFLDGGLRYDVSAFSGYKLMMTSARGSFPGLSSISDAESECEEEEYEG